MYLLHQMLNILCTRTVSGNLELCSSCDKHEPFFHSRVCIDYLRLFVVFRRFRDFKDRQRQLGRQYRERDWKLR